MSIERIPFQEAISEPLLFKEGFQVLSTPQQMILKVIYGQPLNEAELRYWSAFSGAGVYDKLGYLVDLTHSVPYEPREYADVTLIMGRRSGKTDKVSSFVIAYEALCGGHKRLGLDGQQQDPVFIQVAQDLNTARANLRQFILNWLQSSPIGRVELDYFKTSAVTIDRIRLKEALICVGPPTMKLRGQAIACCAMDELCVWPKDREASNPDHEVQSAIKPALMQFYPYDKVIKVSTPMTEEGLLWQASQIGTRGEKLANEDERLAYARTLVLTAPTAAMENPKCSRSYLIEQRATDADAFPREYLAKFSKSVSGFLSTDLLRGSVEEGVISRPPQHGVTYVATLDPAFRKDAFAFTIGHLEGGKFVQDYIHSWRGTPTSPLRPGAVLDEIGSVAYQYGLRVLTTDQHHTDSLMELAQLRGLVLDYCPITNDLKKQMWADFNSLLLQGRLRLLDHADLLDELMKMERHLTASGQVQIQGGGTRDDLAMVTALAVYKALQAGETVRTIETGTARTRSREVKARVKARARGGREEEGSVWWL